MMEARAELTLDDGTEYAVEVRVDRGDAHDTSDPREQARSLGSAAWTALVRAADLEPQRYITGVSGIYPTTTKEQPA